MLKFFLKPTIYTLILCVESYVQQVASICCLRTNRLRRRTKASNTFLNKSYFLNTFAPFNGAIFEIWKARFRICIHSISFELWETIIDVTFVPSHQANGEVVDKHDFVWTVEEKRKLEIDFKAKNVLVMTLDDSKLLYIYNCKTVKEI